MAWIFVDKDGGDSEQQMRTQMRRNMRGGRGYREHHGGSDYERGYRYGYKHGWEDSEDEDMEYRRSRDSRGRFI